MLEHITRALYYFNIHLLYASIVCTAAWLLTSVSRGSATTKYWIWVATSLNFIVPVGAVVDAIGAPHLSWARPIGIIGGPVNTFTHSPAAAPVAVLWLLGAAVMFIRLGLRITAERRDVRVAAAQSAVKPNLVVHGVPVRFSESCQAPAVDGLLRPYISLPTGIDRVLSEQELNAVLIHEVIHARRRDNLIRLIHEVGLCLMWFHPLAWITGRRLALYRELSCDESVIQSAHGDDLVLALVKLANPGETLMLQATASSFLSHRLARLAAQPRSRSRGASTLLALMFATVVVAGVFETVGHTACCFVAKTISSSSHGPGTKQCERRALLQ